MKRSLVIETKDLIGKQVLLKGWVHTKRDHGKVTFVDLRDRTGLVQVVGGKELRVLGSEDVVAIEGMVKKRPDNLVNPKLVTGTVELEAKKVEVLNRASELPLPIDGDGHDIDEVVRLKYRYLDMRRPRMASNIRTRSRVTKFIRDWLTEEGFVEIETPILTKTTPEGARDFVVPSRLQPGNFYALPQSPQQYKQLLMVAGMERYFQIARCFRDEDPRADRAYGEFTQLDLEMSFVEQEDILQLTEKLFTGMVKAIFPDKKMTQSPWPRIAHKDAVEKYGSDRPDLRKNKNNKDELAFAWIVDFPLFTKQSDEDFFHGSGRAKFAPSHHMFTAPHPDDEGLLERDPVKVRGLQHDMVLNGYEIGGGSVRIHKPAVQEKVFDLIGFSSEQKAQFEHMLTAFTFGVPPHGGIAPGIDRFLMAALGETSVREVIAFPTSASGQTAVMDAPSGASEDQLAELGIEVMGKASGKSGNVYEELKSYFVKMKVEFEEYEHEPVFTSEEAAKVRGTDESDGAKALIMMADKKPIMLVLPGNQKVDFKFVKKQLDIKDLRMATPEEVIEVTGIPIGAVHPWGRLFGISTYVEPKLGSGKTIVFNAGLHERSMRVSWKDYLKVEKPVELEFAK